MKISRFEARWIARICEGIIPPGLDARMPYSARNFDYENFAIDVMANYPWHAAIGMRAVMLLFNLSPLFFIGKPLLFTSLKQEDQIRYYDLWYDSPVYLIRQMATVVKVMACLNFFGQPEVQHLVGYRKPNQEPPLGERPANYQPQTSGDVK